MKPCNNKALWRHPNSAVVPLQPSLWVNLQRVGFKCTSKAPLWDYGVWFLTFIEICQPLRFLTTLILCPERRGICRCSRCVCVCDGYSLFIQFLAHLALFVPLWNDWYVTQTSFNQHTQNLSRMQSPQEFQFQSRMVRKKQSSSLIVEEG